MTRFDILQCIDSLLQKKLVMVTGKGGIGKSFVTSILAQRAVEMGLRVCIVESSSQDQQAPIFGRPAVGHKMTPLYPRLSVINLNAQDNFRDFVVLHLGFAKLFERVFTKPLVRSFIQMLPGIGELTLLGRIYHICELTDEFDLVIFDGFATGHFLSLLKTPEAVLRSGMVGPVIEETNKVRDFLEDQSKVGVLLVSTPEELVVSESLQFTDRFLNELNMSLDGVVVNKCLSVIQTEAPSDSLISDSGQTGIALDYLAKRIANEKTNIHSLKEGLKSRFDGQPGHLPFLMVSPDFGAIEEPLPDGFHRQTFDDALSLSVE
jgi:anion-transporting  ArsA/GET3 family ATPase